MLAGSVSAEASAWRVPLLWLGPVGAVTA